MKYYQKMKIFLSVIIALTFLSIDRRAENAEVTPEYYPANRLLCPSRYQLVAGEYDVKIKATASNQTKYETHRTMFLIDTYSGKVWLFLAEKDMFQGRWGWIPARGIVKGENTDRKDE
jgi:hypothetical protein